MTQNLEYGSYNWNLLVECKLMFAETQHRCDGIEIVGTRVRKEEDKEKGGKGEERSIVRCFSYSVSNAWNCSNERTP